MGDKGV